MEFLELESSAISTETDLSQAVERILNSGKDRLVVVASAMTGTEESLRKAGEKAVQQDLVVASTLAESARTFYMQLAQQMTSQADWMGIKSLLSDLFEELFDLLKGVYLIGELTSQGRKVLLSCADRASATIVAQALKEKGAQAEVLCQREILLADNRANLRSVRPGSVADCRQEISKPLEDQIIPVIPASARELVVPGD